MEVGDDMMADAAGLRMGVVVDNGWQTRRLEEARLDRGAKAATGRGGQSVEQFGGGSIGGGFAAL